MLRRYHAELFVLDEPHNSQEEDRGGNVAVGTRTGNRRDTTTSSHVDSDEHGPPLVAQRADHKLRKSKVLMIQLDRPKAQVSTV